MSSLRFLLVFICIVVAAPARAGLVATFVDSAFGTSITPGAQYDFASVAVFVDPASTNWIAWNDTPTVSRTDALFPGQTFLWGGGGFGTDDYIQLTVTTPSNSTATVAMDRNDAFGAHILSDPMNVIFGSAAVAPDALRIDAFGPTAGQRKVFDEAGAFNAIFSAAGVYTFDFSFRNSFSLAAGHSDIYLLVDARSNGGGVPEPGSLALATTGLLALGLSRRRRPRGARRP